MPRPALFLMAALSLQMTAASPTVQSSQLAGKKNVKNALRDVSYKGVWIGQPASEIPKSLPSDGLNIEGENDGDWFRVSILNGRVFLFTVIYVGKSLSGNVVSRPISLATALRIHSFQIERNPASFGEAINKDGVRYGVVDWANQIIYSVDSLDPSATVKQVDYVGNTAPVLALANMHPLEQAVLQPLLAQAHALSEQNVANNSATSNPAVNPQTSQSPPEPFGFKVGMPKAQVIALVGQQFLSKDNGDILEFSTAPMPHPDFETYMVGISPSTGLAEVVALSKDIQTNVYGEGVQSKFEEVKTALDMKYGTPANAFDFLRSGSLWDKPEDWMMGLVKEDRTLDTFWKVGDVSIDLEAKALSQEKGYLRLAYQFSNFQTFAGEHKAKANSVL